MFYSYPDVKRLVAEKMLESTEKTEDWRRLFNVSTYINNKKCFILQKLIESTDLLDDLFFVIKNSSESLVTQQAAEDKIVDMCNTFRGCILALKRCYDIRSPLAQKILLRAEEIDVTFDELWNVKKNHTRGSVGVAQVITTKFTQVSASFEKWNKLYSSASSSDEIKSIALKKMKCS